MHGMEKAKDISQKKISDIKILIMNTNHTNRKIASITKVSWATVNCIKKIDKNLDLISRRKEKYSKKNDITGYATNTQAPTQHHGVAHH